MRIDSIKLKTRLIGASVITSIITGIIGYTALICNAGLITTIIIISGMLVSFGFGLYISTSIANPIQKITKAAEKIALGDVEVTLNSTSKDEIGMLSNLMAAMVENIQEQAAFAEKIADGDLSVEITVKSDNDILSDRMSKVVSKLRSLASETNILSQAAIEGKLDTRYNTSEFNGSYKNMVQNVNKTLDVIVSTLNLTSEYIERMSNGDIPQKITDNYNGDFNDIKNNLNKCIDTINCMTTNTLIGPLNMASKFVSDNNNSPKTTGNYSDGFEEIKINLSKCKMRLMHLFQAQG